MITLASGTSMAKSPTCVQLQEGESNAMVSVGGRAGLVKCSPSFGCGLTCDRKSTLNFGSWRNKLSCAIRVSWLTCARVRECVR